MCVLSALYAHNETNTHLIQSILMVCGIKLIKDILSTCAIKNERVFGSLLRLFPNTVMNMWCSAHIKGFSARCVLLCCSSYYSYSVGIAHTCNIYVCTLFAAVVACLPVVLCPPILVPRKIFLAFAMLFAYGIFECNWEKGGGVNQNA